MHECRFFETISLVSIPILDSIELELPNGKGYIFGGFYKCPEALHTVFTISYFLVGEINIVKVILQRAGSTICIHLQLSFVFFLCMKKE